MCRPDGRHVLNNQGTDDYVLTMQLVYAVWYWFVGRLIFAKELMVWQ